jgi:NAD(P)-dependent dehydrogenase (short-subunit alcohol dehydrogenase family)
MTYTIRRGGRGDGPGGTAPVVVITGASAGVGRATARTFARAGARVALLARGQDGLDGARREAQELARDAGVAEKPLALALPVDVADPDAVERAAEAIERDLGPIDVWVNNAMASVFAPLHEIQPDEFRRVTDVSYHGVVYGTMAALRRMRPRRRGTIVQVGSALAYRGIPLQAPYCGSQHAVQGFTESVRCELLHDDAGVRITMVQLPALNTPQFGWVRTRLPRHPQPVPPIYQPEVAADAIRWAAEHAPRELQVGGSTVGTVLANKIAPGLLDRYLARTNYEAQQTERPVVPDRRDNLFEPVAGDHGAHGIFDDEANPRSLQLTLRKHARWLVAAAAGSTAALTARALRR